jgi:hypothetical protein
MPTHNQLLLLQLPAQRGLCQSDGGPACSFLCVTATKERNQCSVTYYVISVPGVQPRNSQEMQLVVAFVSLKHCLHAVEGWLQASRWDMRGVLKGDRARMRAAGSLFFPNAPPL